MPVNVCPIVEVSEPQAVRYTIRQGPIISEAGFAGPNFDVKAYAWSQVLTVPTTSELDAIIAAVRKENATASAAMAAELTALRSEVATLKEDVQRLSDANDALTKRLDGLAAEQADPLP